jgi:hypothetical protein
LRHSCKHCGGSARTPQERLQVIPRKQHL